MNAQLTRRNLTYQVCVYEGVSGQYKDKINDREIDFKELQGFFLIIRKYFIAINDYNTYGWCEKK